MSIVINTLNNSLVPQPYVLFTADTQFRLSLGRSSSDTAYGTPQWDGNMFIKYSIAGNWVLWDGSISSPSRWIYLRGSNNTKVTSTSGFFRFRKTNSDELFDNNVYCTGQIGSLLDSYKVAVGQLKTAPSGSFFYAFYGSPLASAPRINFEEIGPSAFYGAFEFCRKLTIPPALPAMSVDSMGYHEMFRISTINTLPKLPAISVGNYAYDSMFQSTEIKLSLTQTGDYQYPFRVPAEGSGSFDSGALSHIVQYTYGTYTGDSDGTISARTTYYTDKPLVE